MAFALKVAVWVCFGAVAYNYVAYPILLFLLTRLVQAKCDLSFLLRRKSRRCSATLNGLPRVAILISAFNEEAFIEARVKNALEINYPSELAEILIGLDAPTDSTAQILSWVQSPRVRVWAFPRRRGKLAVVADLAQRTSADILVCTDADQMFEPNCVRNLVRHFADPEVGAVSGEEIRVALAGADPAAESLYWHYESALKILESRLNCLHSANGCLYAIRRALFQPRPGLIVEDFQIPLELRFQGYRIVYDPEAITLGEIAPTFTSQFERRVRLGAGNFQTLFRNPGYLNPLKGLPAFAYWSHRVLRWVTPLLLAIAFISTLGLLWNPVCLGLFAAQCAFYTLALLGYWRKKRGRLAGVCRAPLYFCAMNLALLLGLFRYLSGRQSVAWAATPRRMPGPIIPGTSTKR